MRRIYLGISLNFPGKAGMRDQMIASRAAMVAASRRLLAPSLVRMFDTWFEAVLVVMKRRSAISGSVSRWVSRARTSRSRRVRSYCAGAGAMTGILC